MKLCMRVWTGFSSRTVGHSGGSFEHVNKPSGPIKTGNFFDQLSDCGLSRRNFLYEFTLLAYKSFVAFTNTGATFAERFPFLQPALHRRHKRVKPTEISSMSTIVVDSCMPQR
jgi:hypothetical protein